ncbi:B-cell receptor-associated protein 31 [Brevipalpus obovatus]|uniref:B-cell receptor-associated protein 31 n=1 Tax=Brevipalpus obovatus TaxID=246614 RepID=UPI003D9E9DCB
MSLQWTLVAVFLYVEIAIVILLLLPILSPRKWQAFFKSRVLSSLSRQGNLYFTGFLLILVLLFLDSIREMRRYSIGRDHDEAKGHLNAELAHSMKLFRAQRNFYIAGFALFLCLVIRRIASLLSTAAQLKCELEAALKQAMGASKAAEALLKSGDGKKSGSTVKGSSGDQADSKEQVTLLKEDLASLRETLKKSEMERETLKKQAEGLSKEYDRLAEEHTALLKQSNSGSKKGD